MAHTQQERYSKLVDAKLRQNLVKKDGIIFNNRYEGDPKAGAVKIPVRDTEVEVSDYNKSSGADMTEGATTYLPVIIDKDKAINEIIDGYDAASVPDNLVADRLDSGAYSMALQIENDATAVLEAAATPLTSRTPLTKSSVYETFVDARTALSKAGVPTADRWALVSPDTYGLLLKNDLFVHATTAGDDVIATGAVGKIAGFLVFEDATLSDITEFIVGHPNWCSRINEWAVPVHLQDLAQSGKFIGASAVQGRKVYAHKVTKPQTLLIKKNAADPAEDDET